MGWIFPEGIIAKGDSVMDNLTITPGSTLTLSDVTVVDESTDFVTITNLFILLDAVDETTIGPGSASYGGLVIQYNDDSVGGTDIFQDGVNYSFERRAWHLVSDVLPAGTPPATNLSTSWIMNIELATTSLPDGSGGTEDTNLVNGNTQFVVYDLDTRRMIFTPGITYDSSTRQLTTDAIFALVNETTTASTDIIEIPVVESSIEFSDTTVTVLNINRGYAGGESYTSLSTDSDELRLPPSTTIDGNTLGSIELEEPSVSGIIPGGADPVTVNPSPSKIVMQPGTATLTWNSIVSSDTVSTYYIPIRVDSTGVLLNYTIVIKVTASSDAALIGFQNLTLSSSCQLLKVNAVPVGERWTVDGTNPLYEWYLKLSMSEDDLALIISQTYDTPLSPASTVDILYTTTFSV